MSTGVKGFSSVIAKVDLCKEMLQCSMRFAQGCDGTIASFMASWNLQLAMEKIMEMCRIVNLGEMMKQFAKETKRLVLACVALMQTATDKFKTIDLKSLSLQSVLDADIQRTAADMAKQKFSNVTGMDVEKDLGCKERCAIS